ncbi:MAG: alkaline phosphatase [Saprospiraceae bacterium]|nr:alkaline phosphatase [Saprospiraceae bacterium]
MRPILLLALVFFSACSAPYQPLATLVNVEFAPKPKNVIFLIGDGMGLSQVSAHIYWKGLHKNIFQQFKTVGFHITHSANELVTDSAAGATAFSCGHKTTNGAIGITPDEEACRGIVENLEKAGYATGMVVACTATHATPASFIAHRELRAFTDEIAMDFLETPFDCLIAGGKKNFIGRIDKKNLIDSLKDRGYAIKSGTSMKSIPGKGQRPFVIFTDDQEPPTASGGRKYLPSATRLACDFLSKRSEKGFFLMVEGSQIDWAGHANDRNWLRAEMDDFDKTIRAALEFAAADKETLVIVTGDHECGGASLLKAGKKDFKTAFSTRLHTAAWVPVYAYGPQASLFSGVYDNTEIYEKVVRALELN